MKNMDFLMKILMKNHSSPVTNFGKLKYAHNLTLFELAKSFDLKVCHLRVSEIYALDRPEDFLLKNLLKVYQKKLTLILL